MRIFILNALPLVGCGYLSVEKSSVREVSRVVEKVAVSLIGHKATADLLGVLYNRGQLDKFNPGDIYYVVRLKVRLPESGDLPEVSEDDIVVYKVKVLEEPVIEWTELAERAEEAAGIAERESSVWVGKDVFNTVMFGVRK